MKTDWDTIIIGGGMAGLAGAHELARRGKSVLVLEQFSLGHDRGSSAGPSRIFRLSQPQADYARMAGRSLQLWKNLEADYGTQLYWPTGLLDLGSAQTPELRAIEANLDHLGEAHERLDAAALAQRFPHWRPGDDWEAVYSEAAGILNPSLALELLAAMTRALGATLLEDARVLDLNLTDPHIPVVRTARGTFLARRVVIAAGAWLPALLPAWRGHLRVTREQVVFFRPAHPQQFTPGRFPMFIRWGRPEAYGFPMFHLPGVKVGLHISGPEVTPGDPARSPDPALTRQMLDFLRRHLPDAAGPVMQAKTCLYTTTATGDFVYDTHPESAAVLVVSACSGAGFKFLPVHGEIIADWCGGRVHSLLNERFTAGRALAGGFSPSA